MVYKIKFVDISLMVVIIVILWRLSLPLLTESDLRYAQLAVTILTTTGSYGEDTVIVNVLQSWKVWLYGIIFTGVIYSFICILIQPTSKVKLLGEVGYLPENGMNKKDMANRLRREKLSVHMPPVYANGWFVILESHQIKNGEAKAVSCSGLNLAAFRGEDGRPHVIDGYCPHMGAHLAVGGQVKGNCLECPFHGWKFNGESGKCVDIPYSDAKIPESAKVNTHHCLERNNLIYIWYHAEGIEPNWEPPEVQQITNGELTYVGKIEHEVNVHIEEIPENSADLAHLDVVHQPFIESGVDLRYTSSTFWNFVKHCWSNAWYPCEPQGEKHMACMDMIQRVSIFGKKVPLFDCRMDIKQYGPGLSYVTLTSPFGTAVYIHSLTTIEPMLQKTLFTCYVHWLLPTFFGKMLLRAQTLQFERDIMIWNNKRFCMKPLLVKSKSDSTIAKHRKWFSQFYSENSTRLCSKPDTLDW